MGFLGVCFEVVAGGVRFEGGIDDDTLQYVIVRYPIDPWIPPGQWAMADQALVLLHLGNGL